MKPLTLAKSRLTSVGRRDSIADLACAIAKDVVCAALATPRVDSVVVISRDADIQHEVEALGADSVAEPQAILGDLNAVLTFAQDRVLGIAPHASLAILPGDLATLQPSSLHYLLENTDDGEVGFVADHLGTGTSALTCRRAHPVATMFGQDSAQAHSQAGYTDLTNYADLSVRLDIDTEDDWQLAKELGLGPNALALLA